MKDTLCIDGGHSHHQVDVNLVGFHAIILQCIYYSCECVRELFLQLCLLNL